LELSQQGAGIGTRGPGETQLEVDRRRLLRRTQKLERDLRGLGATRATQRKARRRRDLRQIALVGYTNAGKSTLLNRLTHAGVLVQDQLFSTLDPTVRRLHLPGGETVLLSDTVGFVRRLPHQLVEAFRSTLEEVRDADLLLHVVDASAPDADERIAAVETVLREIDAGGVPTLLAWNKTDAADADDVKALLATHRGSVALSAATGEGVEELLLAVGDRIRALAHVMELLVPYERGDVLAALHRAGEVLVEVHDEQGTRVRARLPVSANGRFAEFSVTPE
jgi:GTP-binding protein HflX